MLFEELGREPILVVDDPDQKEAIMLQHFVRDALHNLLVLQCVVGDGDSTSWVGGGELPWRVHRNHIEQSSRVLFLCSCKPFEQAQLSDVFRERDAPELLDVGAFLCLFKAHVFTGLFDF